MAELAKLIVSIVGDISGFKNALRQGETTVSSFSTNLGNKFQSVGSQLTGMGAKMSIATAPIAAGFIASVKHAGDFEVAINLLNKRMQDSGVTADDWASAMLKVGADTDLVGITAAGAAEAVDNFAKAGLNVNQIMGDMQGYLAGTVPLGGALRGAIDLAAASELDLAQASELVIATMGQFGVPVDQIVSKMNNFVQTADASNASVGDLGMALQNVGPVAAALGIPLEDVNTALAILSNSGIKGSEAGSALKSMLLNLQRPTKQVQQALAELNVDLYDAQGNFIGLPAAVSKLDKAMGANSGMTDELRQKYAQLIAGSYGIVSLQTLLNSGASGWDNMTKAVSSAATMQEMAAVRTTGFNAAMEQLQGTMETFMIQVGTPLIRDFLVPAIKSFTEFMGKLMDTNPELVQMATKVGLIAVAAGPFLMILGQMASGVGTIIKLGGAFAGAVPKVIGFAKGIQTAITMASGIAGAGGFGGLAGAISGVAGAIGAALGPILLIIAGIIAAVVALKAAWDNNFLGIRDIVAQVVATIQTIFENLKLIVGTVIAWLKGELTFEEMVATVSQAWQNIGSAIDQAWQNIIAILQAHLEQIWANISTWLVNLATTIATAWTQIQIAIQTILGLIAEGIRTWLENLAMSWRQAWENVKLTAVNLVTQLKDMVLNVLGSLVSGVYEKGRNLAERFGQGIKDALERVLEAVRSMVARIRALLPGSDAATGPLSDLYASGRALPMTFAAGITSGMGAVTGAINQLAAMTAGYLPIGGDARVGPFSALSAGGAGLVDTFNAGMMQAGFTGPMYPMPQTYQPQQATNVTVNIANPSAEPSEASVLRSLRLLAAVGILPPVDQNLGVALT